MFYFICSLTELASFYVVILPLAIKNGFEEAVDQILRGYSNQYPNLLLYAENGGHTVAGN